MVCFHISSILCDYLAYFLAQARKIKKIHPENIPYISGNGTFQLYIKKNYIFSYILGYGIFQAKLEKRKKSTPRKLLIFREMELSNFLNLEILICSQKKLFSYFRKQTPPQKKKFIFQETELPYIFLIFQEVTFRAREMKKPTFKKTSYILNFLYFLKKSFSFISGN